MSSNSMATISGRRCFAKVTVSGADESAIVRSTRLMASCRPLGANHWVSSGFVLCSVSQFDRTGANDISNRAYDVASAELHVGRNLLLGIVAFICVDGAVFHSGSMSRSWLRVWYGGRIWRITQPEKERAPSGLKEVLVLGDSRIAEGFTTVANELGSPAGLKFVSLAEPAVSANTWYYMVGKWIPLRDASRRSLFLTASAMNQTAPMLYGFL